MHKVSTSAQNPATLIKPQSSVNGQINKIYL